jgi:hypothetical protein
LAVLGVSLSRKYKEKLEGREESKQSKVGRGRGRERERESKEVTKRIRRRNLVWLRICAQSEKQPAAAAGDARHRRRYF